MIPIVDMRVDYSDDISIKGDILIDSNIGTSSINTAQRRIVARTTDFLIDNVSAGLERFLFTTKDPYTISDIKSAINTVLITDNLFQSNEFTINIIEKNTRTLYITLIFIGQPIDPANRFRIIVDIENQRIYRG